MQGILKLHPGELWDSAIQYFNYCNTSHKKNYSLEAFCNYIKLSVSDFVYLEKTLENKFDTTSIKLLSVIRKIKNKIKLQYVDVRHVQCNFQLIAL